MSRVESRSSIQGSSLKLSRAAQQIYEWLKSQPCFDCGRTFPTECMDFDHRPDEIKIHSPQKFFGNMEKFLAELAKCDLVCACCHRTRTRKRGMSAEAKKNQKRSLSRPEVRAKMQEARKRVMSDPSVVARYARVQSDPEVNARRSATMKRTLAAKRLQNA